MLTGGRAWLRLLHWRSAPLINRHARRSPAPQRQRRGLRVAAAGPGVLNQQERTTSHVAVRREHEPVSAGHALLQVSTLTGQELHLG